MKIYFRMMKAKPYWLLIIILAILKFLLPFFLQSPVFELQRDEYLYYQQGQHFALGYLENPPLISYLGMISGWLGGTEFRIHFWPSFFGAATVIITCLITAEFGGRYFAQFLSGLGIMCGAFLRMHSLFQPNILDIFFWTLAIYFLIRFIKSENKKFIYACAIAFAFGILSKYSIVFLIAAIAAALLLTYHRKIFSYSVTYKAILIAIIIILPNLFWQWQHSWPLIHHMQELQQTQLQFLNHFDFLKDQLLYLLPVAFVWITGLVWLFRNKQWRFIFIAYFFVIIFLLLGRGKSYYSMGIYPVLIAAGAVAWENISLKKIWVRYAIVAFIFILAIPFVPLLLPLWKPETLATFYKKYDVAKTGVLKWEDQKDHPLPQDFADMLGWKEITQQTAAVYNSLSEKEKSKTIIKGDNYGISGALSFYGRKFGLPEAYSYNGSFLLWIPDRFNVENVITVGEKFPDTTRDIVKQFQSISIEGELKDPFARENGTKIILWKHCDAVILSKFLEQESHERKVVFTRK